jgi:ABC-type glycerol-3-phosphate transport system substrate-binding protein
MPNYAFVTKNAANLEGALAFVDWFTEKENLEQFYGGLKMIPPYMGVESEMYTVAADFKRYFDAQTPFCPKLKANYGMVGNYSSQVVAGTKSPQEALEEMNDFFVKSAKAAGLPGY